MSRFEDLDRFLAQQQALVADATTAVERNVETLRAGQEPLIRACFATLEDYYRTILTPRTHLEVVLKKKEDPRTDPKEHGKPHYVYIVNFLPPREEFPYRDDEVSYSTYWRPGELGHNDWHPNVAMQFGFYLYDSYDRDLKAYTGLEPRVHTHVWGIVQKGQESVAPKDLYLSYGNAWDKHYSTFTIYGDTRNPQATVKLVETALATGTINVLTHRQQIQGLR